MIKIDTFQTFDITYFIPHILLPFHNLEPTLPTIQVLKLEAIYQITCSFFHM